MIKLRLKKYGRKGQPCYRIVAMDSRTKRDGAAIEELGFYNVDNVWVNEPGKHSFYINNLESTFSLK